MFFPGDVKELKRELVMVEILEAARTWSWVEDFPARVMLVVPLLNSSTCYFSFPFILLFLSWP